MSSFFLFKTKLANLNGGDYFESDFLFIFHYFSLLMVVVAMYGIAFIATTHLAKRFSSRVYFKKHEHFILELVSVSNTWGTQIPPNTLETKFWHAKIRVPFFFFNCSDTCQARPNTHYFNFWKKPKLANPFTVYI